MNDRRRHRGRWYPVADLISTWFILGLLIWSVILGIVASV